MKILKSKEFAGHGPLATFVNDNNIRRDDIHVIISSNSHSTGCILFFYGDSEVEEKERNMWGKLKD
ncbi:hypothetical protein [Mucilaginibacter auburnensis]|uniref:Uncharacterized protein n=1 Tax=Mucilaginibacter auburnensis TaxID=1457233 RepID=A0A2H9VNT1_9SPHI|nr:hypothetical protein [Mucilaginibacter auburnensis]PJJ79962.1 hypothetical protein CLV57_3101 [Mucilaginibacter auburnensis]